jgi:hypothetical protein
VEPDGQGVNPGTFGERFEGNYLERVAIGVRVLRVDPKGVRAFTRQQVEIRDEKRDPRIGTGLKDPRRKVVASASARGSNRTG